MRLLILLVIVTLLSACSVLSKKYIPVAPQYSDDVEAKLSQVKVRVMHNERGPHIWDDIEGIIHYPPAAEYALSSKAFFSPKRGGLDWLFNRYVTSLSLKSLIDSGKFQYLDSYWNYMSRDKEPYKFHLEYALTASEWLIANEPNSPYVQKELKRLASYYLEGCNQHIITGHLERDPLLEMIRPMCTSSPRKVLTYYGAYAIHSDTKPVDRFDLSKEFGDFYFHKKEYDWALAWWSVALNSAEEHQFTSADIDRSEVERRVQSSLQEQNSKAIFPWTRHYSISELIDRAEKHIMLRNILGKAAEMEMIKNRIETITQAGLGSTKTLYELTYSDQESS